MQALLRIAVVSAVLIGTASQGDSAKKSTAAKPDRVVLLDPVTGSDGDASTRKTLHASLARHLKSRGFSVTVSGSPRFRLMPSLVRLDVVRTRGAVEVEVEVAIVLVDHGKMDAGFRRVASVRSENPKTGSTHLTATALAAAARALARDVAGRIAELK